MKKSQAKTALSTVGQIILLAAVFVVGGFLLPMYLAPHLAEVLPITTPYEAARQAVSIQIDNRNANNRETVTLGVSNPASSVTINTISYDCDSADVSLAYIQSGGIKEIPCDTALTVPSTSQHRLMVLASNLNAVQIPIELELQSDNQLGRLSVAITVAAQRADEQSQLPDQSTATLRSFPVRVEQ